MHRLFLVEAIARCEQVDKMHCMRQMNSGDLRISRHSEGQPAHTYGLFSETKRWGWGGDF